MVAGHLGPANKGSAENPEVAPSARWPVNTDSQQLRYT